MRSWTFGQRIGAGFAAVVTLTLLIALIAGYGLTRVVAAKDSVIDTSAENLNAANKMRAMRFEKAAAVRGFLLLGDEDSLAALRRGRSDFAQLLDEIRPRLDADEERRALDAVDRAEKEHQVAIDRIIAMRKTDAPLETVAKAFDNDVQAARDELDRSIEAFRVLERRILEADTASATRTASAVVTAVVVCAGIAALLAIIIAVVLTRALARQIGAAVQHVQSSSAELQTAANQQAAGAKEQATAMSEITTTVSELLATSRQIAESAQRVAHVAEETASSARAGDNIVQKANDAIHGINRQVELIVTHMLDLGKKSQQIGGILDLTNELAEQTNILAINASIEAAGAGDSGRRFGVVADEIRKLADRVGGSTKEIRVLIEEIRAAVNTTVMTTETGAKAVDAGSRHFSEVAASFRQIGGLVGTTTEAAREIELSTKQQSTAVEQVNQAIANVAQATREGEASSTQTYQTATQLTTLSRDLLRLVQPQANG